MIGELYNWEQLRAYSIVALNNIMLILFDIKIILMILFFINEIPSTGKLYYS